MKRRELLEGAAALLATSLLPRSAGASEASLIVQGRGPFNLATPLEYLDRLKTPTPVFFVRSHFGPPALDARRRLKVEGPKKVLDLEPNELKRFAQVTLTAVLECSGNSRQFHRPRVPGVQWPHGAMGQADWTGVRLSDVLEKAGVPADAAHVRLAGADLPPGPKVPRYDRSIPLARAMDPSTIIAHRMNGEPLTLAHGAPLRLVVPGWTGNHWIKWLRGIRPQKDEAEGFYMKTGYRMPKEKVAPGAEVKPENTVPVSVLALRAVIARPAEGSHVQAGKVEVAGCAFSGDSGIERVEVSTDGGSSWQKAELDGKTGPGRWIVFRHRFEQPAPGEVRAVARAFDDKGRAQPEESDWNPSGYLWNGWHKVSFVVAT